MEDFNIELAGIPIRIKCEHKENRDFFDGYFTSKEPVFTVKPNNDILEEVQRGFDELNEEEGLSKKHYSDSFLENNAIHILVSDSLIEYDVLMLHGSALAIDGKGIVFSAKSGTGKSTHTKLWREAFGSRVQMINDDKPMIRVDEKKIYGTPWNGKHRLSNNVSVPVNAVIKLERSAKNHVLPLTVKDSLELLMKQTYVSDKQSKNALIMNLYIKLVATVPFYRLGCNMNPEAAQVAYKGLIFNKP